MASVRTNTGLRSWGVLGSQGGGVACSGPKGTLERDPGPSAGGHGTPSAWPWPVHGGGSAGDAYHEVGRLLQGGQADRSADAPRGAWTGAWGFAQRESQRFLLVAHVFFGGPGVPQNKVPGVCEPSGVRRCLQTIL